MGALGVEGPGRVQGLWGMEVCVQNLFNSIVGSLLRAQSLKSECLSINPSFINLLNL